ncbi:NucA/NucB deoxyribonuclease domain-containing protein [Nonomuraea sp. bgisy101]|uniref:NucA/NucB deoxyribonuclease domain-containing protein n=1 Tax=Nonomuraea sp. bgisy101 TaxID=3413784 RepID=UPI003D73EC61
MPEKCGPPYYNGGPPRGPTNSCDEYPFASTIQGALHAKGHFSVPAVNHQQNIDQGHALRSFYSHYRVGGDNESWVWIQPQSCSQFDPSEGGPCGPPSPFRPLAAASIHSLP